MKASHLILVLSLVCLLAAGTIDSRLSQRSFSSLDASEERAQTTATSKSAQLFAQLHKNFA